MSQSDVGTTVKGIHEFSLQWNLDVRKAQATGKICLL